MGWCKQWFVAFGGSRTKGIRGVLQMEMVSGMYMCLVGMLRTTIGLCNPVCRTLDVLPCVTVAFVLSRVAIPWGVFCSIMGQVMAASVAFTFKILSQSNIPGFQVLLLRSAVISGGMLVGLTIKGRTLDLPPRHLWGLITGIAILGNLGAVCFYVSFSLLPVGNAIALTQLTAIFAALFVWLLGWEPMSPMISAGAILCSMGAVVIEQPMLFCKGTVHISRIEVIGASLALLSAMFFGIIHTLTGRIGGQAPTALLIAPYYIMGLPTAFIPLVFSFPSAPKYGLTLHDWLLIFTFILLSFGFTFFNFQAVQLISDTLGTSMQSLAVIFSYLLGSCFLHEAVSKFDLIGSTIICIGIFLVVKGRGNNRN